MQSHLDNNVTPITGLKIEVYNLWAQPSLHLCVHVITSLHQLCRQFHVVPREAIVDP